MKPICRKETEKRHLCLKGEEYLEGLYLLKLAAGQDNEVNEPIHIKYDPGIFMVLGHAASTEPGVWLWEPLRHKQRKGQHSK